MNLGTAIKNTRIKRNLKQKDLAELVGISVMTLSKIESNKTQPHKKTLQNICEKLQIPLSFLHFISLTDEDIQEDKKILFNALKKNFEYLIFN